LFCTPTVFLLTVQRVKNSGIFLTSFKSFMN